MATSLKVVKWKDKDGQLFIFGSTPERLSSWRNYHPKDPSIDLILMVANIVRLSLARAKNLVNRYH